MIQFYTSENSSIIGLTNSWAFEIFSVFVPVIKSEIRTVLRKAFNILFNFCFKLSFFLVIPLEEQPFFFVGLFWRKKMLSVAQLNCWKNFFYHFTLYLFVSLENVFLVLFSVLFFLDLYKNIWSKRDGDEKSEKNT